MNKRTYYSLGMLMAAALHSSAWADPNTQEQIPAPEVVQAMLWENSKLENFILQGKIRTQGKLYGIKLKTKEREMIYEFEDKPLQIRVEITPGGSVIQRRSSSKESWKTLSERERRSIILDSDIAYEDLGIDCVRWSDVVPVGGDSIKTIRAWCYEAKPPVKGSYTKVRYWISADHLAVLRADAYNEKGEAIKRVEVNDVMRVDKVYTIKEMMVSTLIPGRELSSSRTWIEIRKAEPGS